MLSCRGRSHAPDLRALAHLQPRAALRHGTDDRGALRVRASHYLDCRARYGTLGRAAGDLTNVSKFYADANVGTRRPVARSFTLMQMSELVGINVRAGAGMESQSGLQTL